MASIVDCGLVFAEIWIGRRCSRDEEDGSGGGCLVGSGLAIFNSSQSVVERLNSWIPELHHALDPTSEGGCTVEVA